ncbi:MAG: hypothetical protein K2G63_07235 [Oscillospiraceae bacterium]|nr:hypothetical protein [Oscillospiraceae bacterium]
MNSCGSTFSVTALANAIALNFNAEELELLSSLFNQLGYTLEVISAQRRLCQNKQEN